MSDNDNSYIRTSDGATMIEIAPGQFINAVAAHRMGFGRAADTAAAGKRGTEAPIAKISGADADEAAR